MVLVSGILTAGLVGAKWGRWGRWRSGGWRGRWTGGRSSGVVGVGGAGGLGGLGGRGGLGGLGGCGVSRSKEKVTVKRKKCLSKKMKSYNYAGYPRFSRDLVLRVFRIASQLQWLR